MTPRVEDALSGSSCNPCWRPSRGYCLVIKPWSVPYATGNYSLSEGASADGPVFVPKSEQGAVSLSFAMLVKPRKLQGWDIW